MTPKLLHSMRTILVLVALFPLAFCGCGDEKKPADEVVSLEGKIDKIAPNPDGTGKITVVYRDKKDIEMAGIGEVTAETEIMINGAVAKLTDLKVGERVRGQVRVIKQNDERKQIVLKISAERTEVTKPAEPPSTGG